jgi:hypothetical protein
VKVAVCICARYFFVLWNLLRVLQSIDRLSRNSSCLSRGAGNVVQDDAVGTMLPVGSRSTLGDITL